MNSLSVTGSTQQVLEGWERQRIRIDYETESK